jgi:membrane protease YdiL (CAAX protease family)
MVTTRPRFAGRLIWLFGSYLFLVGIAELLLAMADAQIGLAIHALLLLALTLHAGLGRDADGRKLALALTLPPLLRILSLALPLASLPQLAWYPVVSAPLLLSALIVIRQLRMSRAELGLRPGNPLIQLMLMGGGLGIGAAEYVLLGSPQLVVAFSWNAITLLAVILLIFTGFVEELIFRGLLQAAALPALGRWALVYVALLFAALQIGYLSAPAIAFAFGVGLIFAYAARWSGSIFGVAAAHGLANLALFILMPFLARQAPGRTASAIRAAIAAGTTLAAVAIAILAVRAILERRATWRAGPAPKQLTTSPSVLITPPTQASLTPQMPRALLAPATNATITLGSTPPDAPSTARRPLVQPIFPAPRKRLLFTALLANPTSPSSLTSHRAPVVSVIRTLRRNAGLTYVDLALRTQLPARLLAEIEHGLRPPTHDQLDLIFQVLGVEIP